jgi:hypothetical protein
MKDMTIKFRTAYFIGKQELPFTKFKSLLELQKLNGVEMNKNYANDVKCAEMIMCTNDELKSELESRLRYSMYFSVLIDAGTDCSAKENEAINVQFVHDGNVETKLLGVIELDMPMLMVRCNIYYFIVAMQIFDSLYIFWTALMYRKHIYLKIIMSISYRC